jgi:hypothetical protein
VFIPEDVVQARDCVFIYTSYVRIVGFIIWNISYWTEGNNIKKLIALFNVMKDELYSQVNTTIIGSSLLSGKNAGKD